MKSNRRFTLLPSFIVKNETGKQKKLLYFEYEFLEGNYRQVELNFNINEFDDYEVISLTPTKFLSTGSWRPISYVYDLIEKKAIEFIHQDFTVVRGFPSSLGNKTLKLYASKDLESEKHLIIVEINKTKPNKFKILNSALLKKLDQTVYEVKEISEKWLFVRHTVQGSLYYRSSEKEHYQWKKTFLLERGVCYLENKIPILVHLSREPICYRVKILEEDGSMINYTTPNKTGNYNVLSENLGWGTLCNYDEDNSTIQVIKFDFNENNSQLSIREQVIRDVGRPFMLTDNYLITEGKSELKVWYRSNSNSNYKFQFSIHGKESTSFKKIRIIDYPLLPSPKERERLVKFLIPLILIPKVLVILTIEFF